MEKQCKSALSFADLKYLYIVSTNTQEINRGVILSLLRVSKNERKKEKNEDRCTTTSYFTTKSVSQNPIIDF